MEDFVGIPNFPDYYINRNGDVLSKIKYKEGRLLKPNLNNCGYYYVCLYKDKKRKQMKIHRLLALTFLDNPNNFNCVDHIDRDKTNNKLENLRWVTHMTNCQNATRRKDNKQGHKNISFTVDKRNDNEYTYYRVKIERNKKKHKKQFKTLAEAIKHRNEYLTNLGEEIID